MKRKSPVAPEPEAGREIIPDAQGSVEDPDKPGPLAKCEVCGGEAAANPTEQLCWVCRRLKISAWREVEQQMPAQE